MNKQITIIQHIRRCLRRTNREGNSDSSSCGESGKAKRGSAIYAGLAGS